MKWTNLSEKKGSGPKNFIEMVFLGFHILLHENTSQFFCSAPIMLKLTG